MKKAFSARALCLLLTAFALGALFSLGQPAQAAVPGSADDPLVTQDWVEDYVNAQFAPLQQRLDNLSQKQGSNIVLTIDSNQALVNGSYVTIPAAPQLMGAGYTMVPARFIGEALGLTVEWDPVTRKVSFTGQGRNVTLTIDKTTATINGASYAMPYAPVIWNGHTLVHARFVSEAFQCKVDWYPDTRRVTITR